MLLPHGKHITATPATRIFTSLRHSVRHFIFGGPSADQVGPESGPFPTGWLAPPHHPTTPHHTHRGCSCFGMPPKMELTMKSILGSACPRYSSMPCTWCKMCSPRIARYRYRPHHVSSKHLRLFVSWPHLALVGAAPNG